MLSDDLEASLDKHKEDGQATSSQTVKKSVETESESPENNSVKNEPRSTIVDFDGPDDPSQPLNWSTRKKITTTLLYGLTTAGSTWASSIYSSSVAAVSMEFNVSTEVSILGLTLFLFGCQFWNWPVNMGTMLGGLWRRVAVFTPYFIAAIFCFATATAQDIQTVLITRFFVGFFSSAPVTNTGGVMRDIWLPRQRGVAVLCYSMAVVGGPLYSPIAGAAIVQSPLGWRWTSYITGIMMFLILAVDLLVIDETYSKVILVSKAKKLRRETGDWALHAKHEEDLDYRDLFRNFGLRPFQLLFTPICFFIVLYASFVYGIVYLNFAAFQIEFSEVRGWSPVVAALPMLAVAFGCFLGSIVCYKNQAFYISRLNANNGRPVPEARLPPMVAGGFSLAAGLFVFAWTSPAHIHWIGPCIGAVLMGMGFFGIFQGSTNYLVDTFNEYGASAVAANTLLRNVFAGGFPLFTDQMFHKLGVPWACSLLGFVAVAMIPIPFFFYLYGKKIRGRGVWSRKSLE